jgi:hypothetical protein
VCLAFGHLAKTCDISLIPVLAETCFFDRFPQKFGRRDENKPTAVRDVFSQEIKVNGRKTLYVMMFVTSSRIYLLAALPPTLKFFRRSDSYLNHPSRTWWIPLVSTILGCV